MTRQKIVTKRAGILLGTIDLVGGAVFVAGLDLNAVQESARQTQTSLSAENRRSTTSVEFTDMDFAKKKLLYHQLGALLADKAKEDATRPEIRRIADQATRDETARAAQYAALLDSWGFPYTNIDEFPESQGCHGYPTFTGMLPVAEVGAFRQSSGDTVNQTFLSLMISHHEDGNELIRIEGRGMKNEQLIKLNESSTNEYKTELEMLKSVQADYAI